MHTRHICLLGFSKQADKAIKERLEQCQGYDFVWVPASAKILDGVIINAMFLNTPQIKHYIGTVSSPCVAVYTQSSALNIAQSYNIPALQLKDPLELDQAWLDALLSKKDVKASSTEESKQETTPSSFEQNSEKLIEIVKSRASVYVIATSNDKRVYLSPKEQKAYINFSRDGIPGIENWRWQTIEEMPNIESMRRINIDLWLFETIWQSQNEHFNIDKNKFYKLVRWPQPLSQYKRSEALRLAAQIKFHPVAVAELAEKTQLPTDLVEHFLFATNQAGQVETIAPSDGRLLAEKSSERMQKDPDRETKKSFIGRLRSKLKL